ncbi:MAG: bacterial Ig-like domain-containing protein [Paludibacteraceae bacterium]
MKKIFSIFAALLFAGSMMAEQKSEVFVFSTADGYNAITVTTAGTSSTGSAFEFSQGDIIVTGDKGYIKSKQFNVYSKSKMVVSAGGAVIDSIKVSYIEECYPFKEAVPEGGSSTTKTPKSVTTTVKYVPTSQDEIETTFTNEAGGKTGLANMTVYYQPQAAIVTVSVAVAEGQEEMGSVTMSYKANSAATEWTAATEPVELAGEGEEEFLFVATPENGYKFAGWTTTGDITLNSTIAATTEGGLATETSVVTANFERDATLQTLTISGTATKLNYFVGDAFDPAGLVVTATYSDGATDDVTDQVAWTITPAELALATTSVSVVATWNEVSSAAYIVNNIVVTDAVRFEKWVSEIVEGEYLFVDASGTDSIAMNSTIDSKRFQYSKIAINEDGKVLEPSANIIWTLTRDSAFWTIANGENLAARTGSNNQVKFTTNVSDSSRWIITPTEENGHTIVNYGSNVSGKNATLRRNDTYGFACYAASTGTAPVLYKKVTNETFVSVEVGVNDASMGSVYGGGKYAVGATATLTAVPKTGYKLTGWSNNSEITTTTQSFTVTEEITIIANFATGETAIDNAAVEIPAVKVIENGQLVILREGKKYNAMGVRLQ